MAKRMRTGSRRTLTRFLTITSPAAATVAENSAFSQALTVAETGRSPVWAINGGPDAARFTLSGNTLSMTAKDFEAPVDANADNVYVVEVRVTDIHGVVAYQTISVRVTDVAAA